MAGEDGAKPGIIMLADPGDQIGELYCQEFSIGNADDLGRVVGIRESVTVGGDIYTGCVHIQDSSPFEADPIEDKCYARNVGLVLTVEPEAREEIISNAP